MKHVEKSFDKFDKKFKEYSVYFGKIVNNKNIDKNFIIAYVYYCKYYFELKSSIEISKYNKNYDVSQNEKIIEELDKSSKLLDPVIITGGDEKRKFFDTHRLQMSKWTKDTPKEKIIRKLETWTGLNGEEAVKGAIYMLQVDADQMIDHVLELYNFNDITNKNISNLYHNITLDLLNYYVRHRNKYTDVSDSKEVKITNGDKNLVKIKLKDTFVDLNIKIKPCAFTGYVKIIILILDGITKVDAKYLINIISEDTLNIEAQGESITIRKTIKDNINKIIKSLEEDISCSELSVDIEIPKIENFNDFIKGIKAFIEAEEIVEEEFELVKEKMQEQVDIVNSLSKAIFRLIGPDISCCIKKLAPFIKEDLKKNKDNFTKSGKLSIIGERNLYNYI